MPTVELPPDAQRALGRVVRRIRIRRAARAGAVGAAASLALLLPGAVLVAASGDARAWAARSGLLYDYVPWLAAGGVALVAAVIAALRAVPAWLAAAWADYAGRGADAAQTALADSGPFGPAIARSAAQSMASASDTAVRLRAGRATGLAVLCAALLGVTQFIDGLVHGKPSRAPAEAELIQMVESLVGSFTDPADAEKLRSYAAALGLDRLAAAVGDLGRLNQLLNQGGVTAATALAELDQIQRGAARDLGDAEGRTALQRLAESGPARDALAALAAGKELDAAGTGWLAALSKLAQTNPLAQQLLASGANVEQVQSLLKAGDALDRRIETARAAVRGDVAAKAQLAAPPERLLRDLPTVPPKQSTGAEQTADASTLRVATTGRKLEARATDFHTRTHRLPSGLREAAAGYFESGAAAGLGGDKR